MDNMNFNESIERINSKKGKTWLLIIIILLVISAIAVTLFSILGKTENKNTKNLITNTLNLNSYMLTIKHVDSDFNSELTKYSLVVEKKDNVGTIILDKDASLSKYGKFIINGYEVVEDHRFVQEGFNDNYYYYYDGSNVFDSNRGYVANDVDELLTKIKDYNFKNSKGKYSYNIKNDNEIKKIISDFDYVGNSQDYLEITLAANEDNIDTITVLLSSRYIEIKISDYNSAKVEIPDEVQESLARNYFDFMAYGKNYSDKYYALNRNNNGIYNSNDSTCSDGTSKVSLIAKSNNGFFEQYIETNDCNGNKEQQKIYIKNTTSNYLVNGDHSKDVYVIYDQTTNKEIGKFSYDKSNDTIKVYDSKNYNGEFTRKK